ncbi:MAG: hypothetical protein AAFQ67_07580 [Pseudomonadota bacterium]
MKAKLFAALLALSGTGLGVSAQTTVEGEDLIIRLSGDRGWKIECELEKEGGGALEPRARGRGRSSTGSIVGRNVVGGACAAEAGRGDLRLTIVDEMGHFVCPFGEPTDDGLCIGRVGEGETLDWTVERQ